MLEIWMFINKIECLVSIREQSKYWPHTDFLSNICSPRAIKNFCRVFYLNHKILFLSPLSYSYHKKYFFFSLMDTLLFKIVISIDVAFSLFTCFCIELFAFFLYSLKNKKWITKIQKSSWKRKKIAISIEQVLLSDSRSIGND